MHCGRRRKGASPPNPLPKRKGEPEARWRERVDVSFASFLCAKEKEGVRGNEIKSNI